MTIQFMDPRAEPAVAPRSYSQILTPGSSDARLALVANGFPDSDRFVEFLGVELTTSASWLLPTTYEKSDPTSVMSATNFQEIAEENRAAIGVYGH